MLLVRCLSSFPRVSGEARNASLHTKSCYSLMRQQILKNLEHSKPNKIYLPARCGPLNISLQPLVESPSLKNYEKNHQITMPIGRAGIVSLVTCQIDLRKWGFLGTPLMMTSLPTSNLQKLSHSWVLIPHGL